MNGLLLYRQYLENIRMSLVNCELEELKSKKFLDIISREKEIEDIIYIDVILKKAGLNVSFLNGNDFISQKVKLKSKLSDVFGFDSEDSRNDILSQFISEEDSIIEELNSLFTDDLGDLSAENIETSEEVLSTEDFIERNKETLESIFAGMKVYEKNLQKPVEEVFEEDVEDSDKIENTESVEETEDIEETKDNNEIGEDKDLGEELFAGFEDSFEEDENLEKEIEDEDSESVETDENIEKSAENDSNEEDLENNEDLIEEDFDGDLENSNEDNSDFGDNEDIENDDTEEVEHFKNKDYSAFFKDDSEEKNEELLKNFNEDDLFDSTGIELEEELSLNDEKIDDEELGKRFENETNYFLHGVKRSRNETANALKEMAKSKEKLVNSKDVSNIDDALAKMLIGTGANILTLPETMGNFVKALKNTSKKVKDTIVVKEEGEDE